MSQHKQESVLINCKHPSEIFFFFKRKIVPKNYYQKSVKEWIERRGIVSYDLRNGGTGCPGFRATGGVESVLGGSEKAGSNVLKHYAVERGRFLA